MKMIETLDSGGYVADVMMRHVVVARSDCPIAAIARPMIDNRISAVPVVDDGKLIGIVSENDLLRRVERGTERQRPRGLHFVTSDATPLEEYVGSHGQTAGEVMTPEVLTVLPDTPIAEIADIFGSRHIKRMPVVDQEKIAGIVGRANLMQALAVQTPALAQGGDRSEQRSDDFGALTSLTSMDRGRKLMGLQFTAGVIGG
ncbi:MAG TPA: CBS domain-containing protein [Acetobacteraceae bacterium]|jgi:CBS domain-containing protein|nr:CBS domain-containing protein [Acetobacteraceae bacterium]